MRLIDADAFIAKLDHVPMVQEAIRKAMDTMPTIEPKKGKWIKALSEQRWIPVSEWVPEDYEDVLVWFEYFRYGNYNRMYSMHGIGTYSKQYDSWMVNHESGWKDLHILAWMPLPEPWKGEQP